MKNLLSGFLLLLLAATANAQSKADEEAVHKLPQAFCDAWAKHDGHELAKIMADEVDFVLGDRKSTRLNSSHPSNSYGVVCLQRTSDAQLSRRPLVRGRYAGGLGV